MKNYNKAELKIIYFQASTKDQIFKIEFINNYYKLSLNIENILYHQLLSIFQKFFKLGFATYVYFDTKEELLLNLNKFYQLINIENNNSNLIINLKEYNTIDNKYKIYEKDNRYKAIYTENFYNSLNSNTSYLDYYLKYYFNNEISYPNINQAINNSSL